MCRERRRTRDRLLEYDSSIIIPTPHTAGLKMIYPWENNTLITLRHQLYLISLIGGFIGTEEEFIQHFNSYVSNKQIFFGSFSTFPQIGSSNLLYFDTNEKILYYWNNEYIPANTLLIANTILKGGGA